MTRTWTDGRVLADGVDLHYRRSGGSGPVIVAVHGLTDDAACWSRFARALDGEFDVVIYDARGHGTSARADSYAFDAHVNGLLAIVQALGLRSPILLGHSMGGAHAAAAAARAPELPRAVILEDPHWPLEREALRDTISPVGRRASTPRDAGRCLRSSNEDAASTRPGTTTTWCHGLKRSFASTRLW